MKNSLKIAALATFLLTLPPLPGAVSAEEGCTSWVLAGDALRGDQPGRNVLHKNRDKAREGQVVIRVPRRPYESNTEDPSPDTHLYSYLALLSTNTSNQVAAGINEHGLAVANNHVDGLFIPSLWGMGALTLNRAILEYCASVEEAFQLVAALSEENMILTGGDIFLADGEQVAIIEQMGGRLSLPEDSVLESGIAARSNNFVHISTGLGFDLAEEGDVMTRYREALTFLNEREGALGPLECFELSRRHHVLENDLASLNDGSICNYPKDGAAGLSTLFGATFVIDREKPDALSAMWVALGTPDTSIYTPFHTSALKWSGDGANGGFVLTEEEVLPDPWRTSQTYELAEQIREANLHQYADEPDLGMGRLTECFLAIEAEFLAEADERESRARTAPDQAPQILAEFDRAKAERVFTLMKRILAGEREEVCLEPTDSDPDIDEDEDRDTDRPTDTDDDSNLSSGDTETESPPPEGEAGVDDTAHTGGPADDDPEDMDEPQSNADESREDNPDSTGDECHCRSIGQKRSHSALLPALVFRLIL